MIIFDDLTGENAPTQIPKWPYIPDYPYIK